MKALIYGRPGCSYCEKAKTLCTLKGIAYDYKIIGEDIQRDKLEEMVGDTVSSVPQIFLISEGFSEYVGGYTALEVKLNG